MRTIIIEIVLRRNSIHYGNAFHLLDEVPNATVDLVICDGPYGVTANEWDKVGSIQEFNLNLIKIFSQKLKVGGSLYLFGKPDCIDFVDYRPFLKLRSRIIWYQPSRLAQGRLNYTNNHDVICYFIKGERPKTFNLDDIRIPQLVELEHRLRCERVPSVTNGRFGKTKFNQNGKNPGDVWGDIKQLTYKSKELVDRSALNTIQKPERLIERLILASSNTGDLVLDPFSGVGTSPTICKRHGRDFLAFEINSEFVKIGNQRLTNGEPRQQSIFNYNGYKESLPSNHTACARSC
ncbi:MAG: DNA-methyltransferase [Limisphaerales bacterium]